MRAAPGAMPGPCLLCGGTRGTRADDGWRCAVCLWRYGDAPDADLPPPRVDVVYYLRFDARVKIGTSAPSVPCSLPRPGGSPGGVVPAHR